MFSDTITLFNFHRGTWYSHKLDGVDATGISDGSTATALNGKTNNDIGRILIQTRSDMSVGDLRYLPPKEYVATNDVTSAITFQPKTDFIVLGNHVQEPVLDDSYTDGFYSVINAQYDGAFMIAAATPYSLIPHFEIEVR